MGFKAILGKVWSAVRPGIEIAAFFVPAVRVVDAAIDAIELAREGASGKEKHEQVREMALAAVANVPLTDNQKKELNEAIDAAIVAAVAQRNATVKMKDAYQELQDAIESFKASSDGTGVR